MGEKNFENFPYEIEQLTPQENKELADYLSGVEASSEHVRIGPKKFIFQKKVLSELPKIYNFPLKHDDTFVVTFPKSGTTFTQDLVWLLCNNLDFEKAQSTPLNERFPFLEVSVLMPPTEYLTKEQIEVIQKSKFALTVKEIGEMPSPRFIKSHLPLSLLPPMLLDYTKVVYVARDPRDAVVSFYYHHTLMKMVTPDKEFKQFWNMFITNKIMWGPYFEHVLEAWKQRKNPNMLFLFYEDMIKDLPKTIRRVATFLNTIVSDEQVSQLADHLNIDNFKKNKSVNLEDMRACGMHMENGAFIRKGKSGGWREHFDDEMTAQADEWIAKNLRDTDFKLPHC